MKFKPLIILLALLSISGCNFSLSGDVTPPPDYVSPTPLPDMGTLYPEEPPHPARGEGLFYENCAPCHGEAGLGNGIMSSLLPVAVPAIGLGDISKHASPATWYRIISQGNMERGMPPFYEFPVNERWDVLAYVFLLSSSPEELQSGKRIYETNCTECHGLRGIDNLLVDFTDQEYMSQMTNLNLYRNIAEGQGEMKPFAGELKEDDIWSVTYYLRSLSYDMSKLDPTPTFTFEPTLTITPMSTPTGAGSDSKTPEDIPTIEGEITETPIPNTFEISGIVTNVSGTDLDGDLTATLVYYNTINRQVFYSQSTDIKTDGTFIFSDLDADPDTAFWVTVNYQGVTYYSELSGFDDSTDSLTLPVLVYDAITEWTKLRFDIVQITMEISNDILNLNEIYIISNPGQSTVIIETDGTSLPFIILPKGVSELTSLAPDSRGASFLPATYGIALPPIVGNQYGIVASFSIPYNRRLDFIQEFPMAVNTISLFAPEKVRIKTEQLQNAGTQDFNGAIYQILEISDFPSGFLSLTITGTTGESDLTNLDQRSWFIIVLGALGVLFVGLGIYLYFRNRNTDKKEEAEEEIKSINEREHGETTEDILDAIIALDEKLLNGKITNEVHKNQREQLILKIKSRDY
jgi:mono/diheme cytochrome c family protein